MSPVDVKAIFKNAHPDFIAANPESPHPVRKRNTATNPLDEDKNVTTGLIGSGNHINEVQPHSTSPSSKPKPAEAFTEKDIQFIRLFYETAQSGEIKLSELALLLGRNKASVAQKASRLGLCRQGRSKTKEHMQAMLRKRKENGFYPAKIGTACYVNGKHPKGMLGKKHKQAAKDLISAANKGTKVPPERTLRRLKTVVERYGSLAPNVKRGSWKSAWREIGGRRIFARSRWEANYARYMQFLKLRGEIMEWEHEPETFWFEKIKRGVRSYLPDFRITLKNGTIEYHEVKGWMDSRSKTKIKRMAKYHPHIVLLVKDKIWFKNNSRTLSTLIPDWE